MISGKGQRVDLKDDGGREKGGVDEVKDYDYYEGERLHHLFFVLGKREGRCKRKIN